MHTIIVEIGPAIQFYYGNLKSNKLPAFNGGDGYKDLKII